MTCPHCNTQIPATVAYCPACGADLRALAAKTKRVSKDGPLEMTCGCLGVLGGIALFLGALYGIIQFVKWAWNN